MYETEYLACTPILGGGNRANGLLALKPPVAIISRQREFGSHFETRGWAWCLSEWQYQHEGEERSPQIAHMGRHLQTTHHIACI